MSFFFNTHAFTIQTIILMSILYREQKLKTILFVRAKVNNYFQTSKRTALFHFALTENDIQVHNKTRLAAGQRLRKERKRKGKICLYRRFDVFLQHKIRCI